MTSRVMAGMIGRPYARLMATPTIRVHAGPILREWRTRRHLSQLDLSVRTGVSTRHLSCVETGRARPSRDLLVFLADELDMPARVTNELLLAAGFAPVFSQHELDDDATGAVRDVVRLVLDGNDPNPTTVIDTRWDLLDANAAALWLARDVDPDLLAGRVNIARLSLHPGGLAPRVVNLHQFAGQLLRHMRHVLASTHEAALADLIAECERYVPDHERVTSPAGEVVLPMRIVDEGRHLAFLSTITTFGAARDVTISELSIETLYPADAITRAVLERRPWLESAATA
jgi:transcriptional regulator with XRE-family HTH domain